jgi:hypothetical protein
VWRPLGPTPVVIAGGVTFGRAHSILCNTGKYGHFCMISSGPNGKSQADQQERANLTPDVLCIQASRAIRSTGRDH